MARLDGVNREGVERSTDLRAAASEAVIRTRANLETVLTELYSEVKTESVSREKRPVM
jgi:hypothetical protein